MQNKDLYKEEIFNIATTGNRVAVVNDKPVSCGAVYCDACDLSDGSHHTSCVDSCVKWMNRESMDWTKVPVDTKILVRDRNVEQWQPRYFARFEDGKVYAWNNGATSFSEKRMTVWAQAKLFEEDKNEE